MVDDAYVPQSVGHCSLQGGRAGSLCWKSTGQGEEGRLTHCSTPQGLETVLEDRGWGWGPERTWIPELLCAPESGVVSGTTACVGKRDPSCLGDERPDISIRALPSPGCAPQTSRCIKKSQSPLSPFFQWSVHRQGGAAAFS